MLGNLPNFEPRPMVIFGAGASYDLKSEKEDRLFANANWKPPLSESLFDTNNVFFKPIISKYRKIQGVIGAIQKSMNQDKSLEQAIDEEYENCNQEEKDSLEFYIVDLIYEISKKCRIEVPANNYETFFRLLNKVCAEYMVVNFNYDYLAQRAMENSCSIIFENGLNTYIDTPRKLIQIHGSVFWERVGEKLSVGNYDNRNSGFAGIMPPLITGKRFACPDDHIDYLKNFVKEVNVVIIVGWKGLENHFRDNIVSLLPPLKRIIVVGSPDGGREEGKEVLKNSGISRLIPSSGRGFIGGFSNFLKLYPDFTKNLEEKHLF